MADQRFDVQARAVRDLGLRDADDETIFQAARLARAVVLTKDSDFISLVERFGPPPQLIWITIGNTPNAVLRGVLERHWSLAIDLLAAGEPLVEIGHAPGVT